MTEQTIELRLSKIEEKLDRLINYNRKQTWVSVSVITELTGWHNESMRKAREQGLVKFKTEDNKFKYCLESIDEKFIIKKMK